MTASTPPALPADLTEGLKRLKMSAMRRVAPELLVTAKTQRWSPEEFLRTLVEAEIAARDESNARTRMKAAGFPVTKTLDGFDVTGSSVPAATFDYLSSLEWVRAAENVCLIGPAGTGKTYLAVACAVDALEREQIRRILLVRPAVEAGERLGYLPGTLNEKIDPYLRPLYDALHDMVDPDSIPRLMASGTIEVAPLAYMRGRTLNDAFVILDEAQNTTPEQMKMFLTRLGFGSKIVVTGDITQIDLPGGARSGLRAASEILVGIDGIHFAELNSSDVVRHRLLRRAGAASLSRTVPVPPIGGSVTPAAYRRTGGVVGAGAGSPHRTWQWSHRRAPAGIGPAARA